ncbi:MAG: glycosyl hydrolase family protein [Acidobacteriaceae bacterium]
MNRREFLRTTAASAAVAAMPRALRASEVATASARLTIHPSQFASPIAHDFLGLSYESAQLAHPEYFSARNTGLAGFLRVLGPGVLRIGGNTSEYAFWTPKATSQASQGSDVVGPDKGHHASAPTQTTPQAIRNLKEFLDLVDWRCMYGLNLGKGTPQQAADEAAYVSQTLGDRLISFQFGNETDFFQKHGLRPSGYDYADFAKDWLSFYDAVHARVPNAKFAGPDTGGAGVWVEEFAQQFKGKVDLLTTHYYAEGPPTDPSMTIERLLSPKNSRWDKGQPMVQQAMAESHLPFRLTETNSCYSGGKPGVSNTFASSLWALDLMSKLLNIGASGINFHTGGYGWYAPVAGSIENGFVARPEYYALLLFSQLVGGRIVASQLEATSAGPLLVCFAARDAKGKLRTVVINKNPDKNVRLAIHAAASGERVAVQRLIAPTLEDEQDVTFAGAPVGYEGAWRAARTEHIHATSGTAECFIPAASAALLRWE